MLDIFKNEEKKVEYVELIYNLMFVYVIGRNNSLVHHVTDGFISPGTYLTYLLCTLITIQIWYSTTIFINRYGSNHITEYIGLFINMYLLYYMADATRINWQTHFYRYNIAWLLIIVNILVQYYLKLRNSEKSAPWEAASIKHSMHTLLVQIIIIAAGMLVYRFTGLPLTPLALIAGMILSVKGYKNRRLMAFDFMHLTERIMLYIVFTFGEMIIAISSYFTGEISLNGIYFSGMAFLIVVGLFMSYGFMYDRLIDREYPETGNIYMFIHIFIIFALSNLTTAIEFMREEQIDIIPKNIFLIASFVAYYVFLFMLVPYTKGFTGNFKKLIRKFIHFIIALVIFVILMIVLRFNMYINIALSVILTFVIWYLEYRYWKSIE